MSWRRQGNKYIASGVRTDFEKLLKEFSETDSVRFEDFASLWRQKKMTFIFCGRENEMEVREFTEECLRMALEFCLPQHKFQVQVGGLYLLYAIFYKQPNNPRAKIRVTKDIWQKLQTFLEEVRSQHHLDIEFVFLKLVHANAFHHVTTVVPLHPLLLKAEQLIEGDKREQGDVRFSKLKSVLNEVMSPAVIDQLKTIHEKYHQMKVELAGEGATRPVKAFDVIDSNFDDTVQELVAGHEESRRKTKTESEVPESSKTDDSDPEWMPAKKKQKTKRKTMSFGERRAQLKAKAFESVPTLSKSRRHRQIIVTSPESESSKKRRRRSSASHSGSDSDGLPSSVVTPSTSAASSVMLHMPTLVEEPEPERDRQEKSHHQETVKERRPSGCRGERKGTKRGDKSPRSSVASSHSPRKGKGRKRKGLKTEQP